MDEQSDHSTIAGGDSNLVDMFAPYSAIGGGRNNLIQGQLSVIAGGDSNRITNILADHNFIGGGLRNIEDTPSAGVIGGGYWNYIGYNGWGSAIGGGRGNQVLWALSFIGAGDSNTIYENDTYSALVGGQRNRVASLWSFLGGGRDNYAHGDFVTLGGGDSNFANTAYGLLGGGYHNYIDYNSDTAVLVGGAYNYVDWGNASFLGGGSRDSLLAAYCVIDGGSANKIDQNSDHSVIGGGDTNLVQSRFSTIAGGQTNAIAATAELGRSDFGFIGGGQYNRIKELEAGIGTSTTMPMFSVVSGGDSNEAEGHFAATGGGRLNSALGEFATIPGGYLLDARDYQTVIGVANRQYAAAALLNNTGDPFTTPSVLPSGDDRVFMIGNGTVTAGVPTRSNAFEVSSNGHSIVFDTHGTGGAELNPLGAICSNGGDAVTNFPTYAGATYRDNVIYAWADVEPNPSIDPLDPNQVLVRGDFGVQRVQRMGTGDYEITLALKNAEGNPIGFASNVTDPCWSVSPDNGKSKAAVSATIIDDGFNPECCAAITYTRILNNKFHIHIKCVSECAPLDKSFSFIVTGRPQ